MAPVDMVFCIALGFLLWSPFVVAFYRWRVEHGRVYGAAAPERAAAMYTGAHVAAVVAASIVLLHVT